MWIWFFYSGEAKYLTIFEFFNFECRIITTNELNFKIGKGNIFIYWFASNQEIRIFYFNIWEFIAFMVLMPRAASTAAASAETLIALAGFERSELINISEIPPLRRTIFKRKNGNIRKREYALYFIFFIF